MDYDARKDSLQSEQESEKVEIYFSIKSLNGAQVFLEVYMQETNKPKMKLLKTKPEPPYNGHYDFPESLTIEYFFEVRQKIIVQVCSGSGQRQVLGQSSATVGEIFNARSKGIDKEIMAGGTRVGTANFRGEKVERGTSKYVEFELVGRNVDVGSYFLCFGEGGAHWKLYKAKDNEEYLLYESEVREGKDNRYNALKINEKRLCNNNSKQPIIFRFFENNGHSLIGQARTDLHGLAHGNVRFTLMKGSSEKGTILLQNFKQTVKYDFTDYLASGMQMAMVVCIDFTASNGIQSQPSSLHYTTPSKKSQYEEALHEVCNIVLDYDTDKLVPTFGFGAKVGLPNFNTGGKVHHCFPINGSEGNPNLFQLPGIMQGYRNALPYLAFSGPTFFAPLLREAMGVCENMKKEVKQYMILLILTDGVIHDKEEVKDLLVKCGKLPLSIIIIGIGNGDDWSAMHELDDDDCLMTDFQGNKTQRDLVQFVEFSQHNNNGVELAREVLEELPRQVEEYHQLVGMTPESYKKNLVGDILEQQRKAFIFKMNELLPEECVDHYYRVTINIMSVHRNLQKVQPPRESSLLPSITKKLSLKTEKHNEKNAITDRYDKFIKDEEVNLKRDLQKLHMYEMGGKQTHRRVKNHQEVEEEKAEAKELLRKARSTPKLGTGMGQRKKSTRDRYINNERLSLHLNLPKEINHSMDSSEGEIHKALLKEEEPRYAEPAVYVLSKNTQANLIRERSNDESMVFYTEKDLTESKIEIQENNQSFPMIPNIPFKQQQIYTPPREEKYIKEKFVGQEAISKFYNRYKNIEKVRQMQHFKLEFNPLTVILTILEHYNIPPKRMQVIKLKGQQAILDLKNCGLGKGVSIKAVAEIIQKVKVFEEVDLSYNSIQSDLCDLIIPNLARMRRINISYNKIGRRGMELLTKMVYNQDVDDDCELEELNLESNYINDTAIGNIFSHFTNINSLLILNLSKNYLGNFCASRLKEFLVNDNTLVELYLHWAQLGTKATKLIFQGLAKNNGLKVLDISWNQIGMDGIRPLCNFLTNNTTLIHLDISFCEIDEIDTRKIAKVLKNNHTIYGLHYQGNMGFIDFKGYLHAIKKEDRYIPISIRAGLIQRISSINIIKDNHAHGGYESMYYKSICWICEGWEQKYFKINKSQGDKACFIHFDFEAYNGVLMSDKGSYFQLLRMCPLKSVHYFHTKVTNQNVFLHSYIQNQSSQVKLDEFNSKIHEFIIDHKRFHEVHLKFMNITPKPRYYAQIFNEDYLTKIHCLPRSDDLKANQNLFVSIPVIQQDKNKPAKEKKKKKQKPKKKKEPQLIKEIEVKEIPQDFDSLFNKNVGDGQEYQIFIKKCVDFDIKHSKIAKIVKNQKELADVRSILQKNYDLFQKIYYYLANNNPSISGVYSIPEHRFQKFIQEQNYQSKRVTKAKIRLKLITCLSNQQGSQGQIQGFYRPQFFEFLMRVAIEKWCQSIPKKQNETQQQKKKRQKYPLPIPEAFLRMLKTLKRYEQKADPANWRRENWSSYEINVVLKSYHPVFERIYEKYAGMTQKNMNTKSKKKMLLEEFKMICLHADLRKTKQALKDLQVFYRTAKKLEVQDGISDTGLDFPQFLQTFSRFAEGLYLKPIGSESHPLWQKQLILNQQIPLFLKMQKLLKQIYKQNHDIKNKKFDILFENGLFPEQISVLMTYFKDKYEGGKDFMRKTIMMKHLKINSLEQSSSNKITLKFLIDLLKVKAAQIQQQNRQKMMQIEEQDENIEQQDQGEHD